MTDPMRRETTEGKADIRTLKRVAPYLWGHADINGRARIILALFFLVVAKIATISTPFFYKFAVDSLGITPSRQNLLFLTPIGLVIGYGMMTFGAVLFAQLRDGIFARVGQRAMRQLALDTFRHIHALSMRFHIQRKTGTLSRIIERGVKGVEFLLRFMLFSVIPLILELFLVAAVFYIKFNLVYFAIIVFVIAVYVYYTISVTNWRLNIRKTMNEQDGLANQRALDSLLNFETVRFFAAEEREAKRYDKAMEGYEKAAVKTNISLSVLNAGQSFIIVSGLVAVMILAARGVLAGTLTVGDFVMVNAFMIQITMPLNFLGTVYREIRQSLIDMRDMFQLLDQPPEIQDRPLALPLEIAKGKVAFQKVSFAYDPQRPILREIDFTIEGGKSIAIVGESGAGKSTLSRLLNRFYDIGAGSITIDGQDIRDVTQTSLRQVIGVVPQDTVLFNDTIFYNIAYGKENSTEDEVIAVAKAAHIHDFIISLPDGYQTMVGERGLKLSGGEKQRVAIARTMLKNPPILILDEATSALDTTTERSIQESLDMLAQNRTTLVIAHRLSTVIHADEIIVLAAGEIVERGTHDQLLALGKKYARLWESQGKASPALTAE